MIRITPVSTAQPPVELRAVEVRNHTLTPVEAEVRLVFSLGGAVAGLEIRGRLVGPRCPYASTVEVAYPVRLLVRAEPDTLIGRVLIPEPSLWDPIAPFRYEGYAEVVRGGEPLYRVEITHGLRALQLGPRGLRWNGQPVTLRGVARQQLTESDALRLRQAGSSALLLSLTRRIGELDGKGRTAPNPEALAACADNLALCEAADRLGFWVIARVPNVPETGFRWARHLGDYACGVGWLVPQEAFEEVAWGDAAIAQLGNRSGCLLGVELKRPVSEKQLAGVAFLCCREELLPELKRLPWPKLILTDRDPLPDGMPAASDLLGWVRG
jgi:hypothetical protein